MNHGNTKRLVSEVPTSKKLDEKAVTRSENCRGRATWLGNTSVHSLPRSPLTDTMALASFASVRVAPALANPRVSRAAPRRGLVIVAGKKGAWAKEFDPEFEKKNAPAEVDESKWPGLDSAYARISRTRPRRGRAGSRRVRGTRARDTVEADDAFDRCLDASPPRHPPIAPYLLPTGVPACRFLGVEEKGARDRDFPIDRARPTRVNVRSLTEDASPPVPLPLPLPRREQGEGPRDV